MSHQLQQRLQRRFTTEARVKGQVSFYRVVSRVCVRDKSGQLVIDHIFDGNYGAERYVKGGSIYVEIYQEAVLRKCK